ncbi:EAL domain-containing protein (putative c-di-GMP-specific phosphodiesterase class I) [Roseinatronobacter thiooxidans]|uniref:EAL domain-containing protein (Putative c-di-GMP-specific phosphodiesterase class I) n=1 Tax=Roseinatronobacter thiooxidans TaxID=121821 RepID=A0A2W7Q0F0_9RHOB|nr:EAL domain-containing protein [Roseinatronobacter thiooxidans]PZX41988.1 EAL domain-containing protein (putative c-di-GMP-specific phosphodiesterase class I) [Roseinatronobacter thiooxidans]
MPTRLVTEPPVDAIYGSPLSCAAEEQRRDTLKMVRAALEDRRAVLAFQPVVQARMPKRAAFYEGLIRIIDHTGRVIPAADFMDAVETNEIGRRIDCLALEMGLATLASEPSVRISVNMSARSIGYPEWLATLERGLRHMPQIGERLILEITESSAMVMPDMVTVFMQDMQERGICFALDDFGAGYTAFRYLKDFYFDIVKIDGAFIRDITHEADNQILVQALVSIARHFDMFTVAESVETAEDAQTLVKMGVDCLQGYYFGAPSIQEPWKISQLKPRRTG